MLQLGTAQKLAKAQERFLADGYSLIIYDGYRPLSVQEKMHETIADTRYIAAPPSNHTVSYTHLDVYKRQRQERPRDELEQRGLATAVFSHDADARISCDGRAEVLDQHALAHLLV